MYYQTYMLSTQKTFGTRSGQTWGGSHMKTATSTCATVHYKKKLIPRAHNLTCGTIFCPKRKRAINPNATYRGNSREQEPG
jgi:hypothetical protein